MAPNSFQTRPRGLEWNRASDLCNHKYQNHYMTSTQTSCMRWKSFKFAIHIFASSDLIHQKNPRLSWTPIEYETKNSNPYQTFQHIHARPLFKWAPALLSANMPVRHLNREFTGNRGGFSFGVHELKKETLISCWWKSDYLEDHPQWM